MVNRARVAIVLHPNQDARRWRKRFESGLSLDRTPYGYDRAEQYFDLAWSRTSKDDRLRQNLRRWSTRWLGCDVLHAWQNRALIRGADVVWTHTEREHLAVAWLQLLTPRKRRVPVIAKSVWLWDRWPEYGPVLRWLNGRLLRTHAVELVHSPVNYDDSVTAVPGRRVELIPFGSAAAVVVGDAVPTPEPREAGQRPLVLAVGNDADRDWELLATVAGLVPEADFRIASPSRAARAVTWPENAILQASKSAEELRQLYHAAEVIVLPLRPNRHISGATVCIEALAAGRRIVANAAGGIEYLLGDEGRTVAPGDATGFADAVRAGIRGEFPAPSPDAYVSRGLTQADYVGRFVLVTRALLGTGEWCPEISAFAPVGVFEA